MNALVPINDLQAMANAFSKSGLFGAKTTEQCLALLLLAQGEGMHPAIAMRDFDVIQNRPAKKAEAMLRSFLAAGGTVEWHDMTDTKADASFTHPQGSNGKPVRITWDMERAKKAGLSGKDNWTKYARQMLANRVISEGCRRVYPAATSGLYEPGEVRMIARQEKDMGKAVIVDEPQPAEHAAGPQSSPAGGPPASQAGGVPDPLIVKGREMAEGGEDHYKAWWESISAADRKHIGAKRHEEWKQIAVAFDRAGA